MIGGLLVTVCWLLCGGVSDIGARPSTPRPETVDTLLNSNLLSRLVNDNGEGIPSDTVRKLAQSLYKCGVRPNQGLRRVLMPRSNATCNDGSPSGYYIRKSHGSKRWIVFLEGGWYCYDHRSCQKRWMILRSYMSSTTWPEYRYVAGVLSPDPEENPYWWNANHVFIPYCSSDSWSGDAPSSSSGEYSFMGSRIVEEVVKDLVRQGLRNDTRLILAGSSAGGTGVILNLDRVADLLSAKRLRVDVRGVADSGWFLDNPPFAPIECMGQHPCAPIDSVKMGMTLWNSRLPSKCRRSYPDEPWRCFFGYRVYPTLKAPLFVFQWLFDEAQMMADVGAPVTKEQWNYIHKMGHDLRKTFENVSALFAPSCISHTILTQRQWRHIEISGTSLPKALSCWEYQGKSRKMRDRTLPQEYSNSVGDEKRGEEGIKSTSASPMLADTPLIPRVKSARKMIRSGTLIEGAHQNATALMVATNSARRQSAEDDEDRRSDDDMLKRNRRRRKKHRRKNRRRNRERGERRRRKRKGHKRKRQRKEEQRTHGRSVVCAGQKTSARTLRSVFDLHLESWLRPEAGHRCQQRLIERCTWPQCNHSCPKLQHPVTGDEIDFIELLKSLGLDMSNVAFALGVDLHTLNNMDHKVVLHLLAQQTS